MKRYLAILLASCLVALCLPFYSHADSIKTASTVVGAAGGTGDPSFGASVSVDGTPLANGSPDVVGTAAMQTVTPAIPPEAFATQTALATTPSATASATPAVGAFTLACVPTAPPQFVCTESTP